MKLSSKVSELIKAGVQIRCPESVEIGMDVDISRIAPGVCIHAGSRLRGEKTSIGPGCIIGAEAPATIEDCQLGRNVSLKGGFFSGAVFLDGANMGSCAHVRAGTILEEEANGAHSVGLKQTILLPFVTLGSLINFCDILMAGGTSRKDHSEVGSSYIHFNYTPHQDKATASLAGDVPNGVFLNQRPVFLGGQGGLVGPAKVSFGSTVAAGYVCRRDITEPDQICIPQTPSPVQTGYDGRIYKNINRIVRNNLCYIGNVIALREWYRHVRSQFMKRDAFDQACYEGAEANLGKVLAERIKRLGDLAGKVNVSIGLLSAMPDADASLIKMQQRFVDQWPAMEMELCSDLQDAGEHSRQRFIEELDCIPVSDSYIETVRSLTDEIRKDGRDWLQAMVNSVENLWNPEK